MADALSEARDAYARRDWLRAEALFTARDGTELTADDLAALSDALWWLGRIHEALTVCESAHRAYLRLGNTRRAASTAMDLAFLHFFRSEEVLASTWLSKAKRLLRDDPDCLERAYLTHLTEVEPALESTDLEPVIAAARQTRDLALRFADPNLVALTLQCEGRAQVKLGRVPEGLALLDEAMAAVLSEELRPDWAGNIYCNVIAACHELADLPRMRAWTESLERWCANQSSAVMFTGICRVHRAELLQTRGDWARAEAEAVRVCVDLKELSTAATADAHQVIGDARRLRGDLAGAERAYLAAHELGRDPQPGMALLRLAQHDPDIALKSIQAALTAENRGPLARARLCHAAVEIALAAGALDVARKAADELDETARRYDSPGLLAMAAHARGAVLLQEGHPDEALPVLRGACGRWRRLDAPYECAAVRLLLARAYALLGDVDASERERVAAEVALTRLHASADHLDGPARVRPDGLTEREVEVLALVAVGRSNRDVATTLVLSEKTVARHLSNIFTKIGVSSRTEAAAYAFAHELVGQPLP